jgi:hypothetical protein
MNSQDRQYRHPELVSGSIYPQRTLVSAEKWMLKQVQHDVLALTVGLAVSRRGALATSPETLLKKDRHHG